MKSMFYGLLIVLFVLPPRRSADRSRPSQFLTTSMRHPWKRLATVYMQHARKNAVVKGLRPDTCQVYQNPPSSPPSDMSAVSAAT